MRNQDTHAGGSMEVHFNLPLRFQASLLCCCLFSSNKDDSMILYNKNNKMISPI